jgi:hypothetical protein
MISRKEFSTGNEFVVCAEVSDMEFEMSHGDVLGWKFEQIKRELFDYLKERTNDLALPAVPEAGAHQSPAA